MSDKLKREILFIFLIVILLGCILFVSYKFLYKKNITNNTNVNSNEEIIVGDITKLNLNDSYTIKKSGTYEVSGSISNGLITINTDEDVKLILNNITITNNSGPCIYVENAKNVYITLKGENNLSSTVNEEYDSCIYSKDDLIFDGDGTLKITSNLDGITSKDDLTIKSGTYIINTEDDSIKGKDSVTIDGGIFTINSKGDGIKTTNEEDINKGIITVNDGKVNITSVKDGFDSVNKVIINGGNIKIESQDDGIHSDGYIEINKGTIDITSVEGLEATYIKINDGTININASDDGINCSNKSNNYDVLCEFNGGNITVKMGQGDTDGIDSNGDIIVNGGTINVTGQSTFDYDGKGTINGGTVICNGEEVSTLPNQFMGGGQGGPMMNGPGGQRR